MALVFVESVAFRIDFAHKAIPLFHVESSVQLGNDWVGCGVLPLTFVSRGCLWNRSRWGMAGFECSAATDVRLERLVESSV